MKTFRLINFIVIATFCNFTFYSCKDTCSDKLKEGIITEKFQTEESTYVEQMIIIEPVGSVMISGQVPITKKKNAMYRIKISGKNNGKDKVETIYLTKKKYDSVSVGEFFKMDKDCSYFDW